MYHWQTGSLARQCGGRRAGCRCAPLLLHTRRTLARRAQLQQHCASSTAACLHQTRLHSALTRRRARVLRLPDDDCRNPACASLPMHPASCILQNARIDVRARMPPSTSYTHARYSSTISKNAMQSGACNSPACYPLHVHPLRRHNPSSPAAVIRHAVNLSRSVVQVPTLAASIFPLPRGSSPPQESVSLQRP